MRALHQAPVSSVAAIGAHCDDIAIGAGGTLLSLSRANPGLEVRVLVLTGGGGPREAEERAALAELCPGARLHITVADLPDAQLPAHWLEVKRAAHAWRDGFDPDVVFSPTASDAHQDHRLLGEIAAQAWRDHWILGYEIVKYESDLPRPTMYVPLGDDLARGKVEALLRHYPSQTAHDWFDAEAFLALMRVRGVQSHTRYAEAFVADKTTVAFG